MVLTKNARIVLEKRYLLRDNKGKIIETPEQLFKRVATAIATNNNEKEEFYNIMSKLEFLPNTPTLMNAGAPLGQLSACFVLPIEDNLDSIFTTVKNMAKIHQSGGGSGFNFSKLRPKGEIIKTTKGTASGPISFMRIFDTTTDVMKQGGKRRGANMGILNCNHPDIIEFINSKRHKHMLRNFNTSIAVTDNFMTLALTNKEYTLTNGKKINAKKVFNSICNAARQTGDPGLIFIDEINRKNPTKHIGKIESTNPCGEQPLHPYESCNLGSINLPKMTKENKIDWEKLKNTIKTAVRFLDNVIDANKYPLPEIKKATQANRRIGLGVMGFAEMLIQLKIPYDSNDAIKLAEKLMKYINTQAREESNKIAKQKGHYPNDLHKKTRNATVTTIAPTGTISIIAGATSGIEPIFAVSYNRNIMDETLLEVNSTFEKIAKQKGFYTQKLMKKIAKTGKVTGIKEVPQEIQKLFRTAHEIKPEWHVKMQAAFQKYCDNAVSKTINLPENATTNDVKKAYLLAYKLKCKGITIYRYGSKEKQVLTIGKNVTTQEEYAGGHLCEECTF